MDRVDDGIAASEVEGKQEEGGEEGPQAATGAAEKGEAASSEGKGEEEKPLADPTEQSPPTDTSGGSAAVKRRERLWTTDPSAGVDLAMGPEGIQADRPLTVGKMMQETVARFPQREALRHKAGDEWKAITYKEYYELSVKAAKSFLKVSKHTTLHYSIVQGSQASCLMHRVLLWLVDVLHSIPHSLVWSPCMPLPSSDSTLPSTS